MQGFFPSEHIHYTTFAFGGSCILGDAAFEDYSASDYIKSNCLIQFFGDMLDFFIERFNNSFLETKMYLNGRLFPLA